MAFNIDGTSNIDFNNINGVLLYSVLIGANHLYLGSQHTSVFVLYSVVVRHSLIAICEIEVFCDIRPFKSANTL